MTTQQVTIGEVAEVLPGYALKGRVEPDAAGRYQLIQGKHLTPGEPYRFEPSHEVRITPQGNVERYRVVPGDVLFASRGTANYAVEIQDVPHETIAPATFYILRPRNDFVSHCHPSYLAWVLEQAPIQAQITQLRTGAATPIVPREDLKAVTLPLPPPEEQARIAHLARLMQLERQLLRHRHAATEHYHQAIGRALFAGRLHAVPKEPTP